MKVARFSLEGGEPLFGVVDGDDLVVLSGDPLFHGINPQINESLSKKLTCWPLSSHAPKSCAWG